MLLGETQTPFDFTAVDAAIYRIVLPVDELIMKLPRVLRSALNGRFPNSLCASYHAWEMPIGTIEIGNGLKLGTKDGFEVAFSLNNEHVVPLGAVFHQT